MTVNSRETNYHIRSNLAQQTEKLTCCLTGKWDNNFFHKPNPKISQSLTNSYTKRKQEIF